MAKTKEADKEPAITISNFDAPGDDWLALTGERGVPWLIKQPGLVICGELLGRFPRRGGRKGFFYQVRIASGANGGKPLPAIAGTGEERLETTVQPGEVIAFDESKAFESLQRLTDTDGKYAVYLVLGEKQTLASGNSFWPLVHEKYKILKAPHNRLVQAPSPDDGIPF
jgi:hypothetical protein